MDIKLFAIDKAVKWLVGGELFDFIKNAVATYADEDIPGEEKRAAVQAAAKEFFADALTLFVNIAIEAAVILLNESLTKEA